MLLLKGKSTLYIGIAMDMVGYILSHQVACLKHNTMREVPEFSRLENFCLGQSPPSVSQSQTATPIEVTLVLKKYWGKT